MVQTTVTEVLTLHNTWTILGNFLDEKDSQFNSGQHVFN